MMRFFVFVSVACLIVPGCGPKAEPPPGGPPATKPAARATAAKTTTPAARPDPAKAKALYQKGLSVQRSGDLDGAIELFYQAVGADPAYAPALNHFSWLRAATPDARYRDPAEAVKFGEAACKAAVESKPPTIFAANCLDTLAVAYARAGRFDDAVRTARRAADMARKIGYPRAAKSFEARLKLFESKQPYQD